MRSLHLVDLTALTTCQSMPFRLVFFASDAIQLSRLSASASSFFHPSQAVAAKRQIESAFLQGKAKSAGVRFGMGS